MNDLENSKNFLLKNGGIVVNQKQEKATSIKQKKKEIFSGNKNGTSEMPNKKRRLGDMGER